MEDESLAAGKKNARRKGQTIVCIDESGLSERPHRLRTWAPKGQTPILQHHFRWQTLSAIAGMTLWTFYFRLYSGAIRSPQVVDFLRRLLAEIPGRVLVVWDRLPSHRSRQVSKFVDRNRQRLELHFLPAYAPELNPVEYLWAYAKNHRLANYCARGLGDLASSARRALRSSRRRHLITAFWQQAELF